MSNDLDDVILSHLLEINAGQCSITDEIIRAQTNPVVAEILTGLLYLHEDLKYKQQEREKALLALKENQEKLRQERDHIEQTVAERTHELADEKAKLATSINSLSVGFILVDPSGKIVTINPTAYRILNLPVDVSKIEEIIIRVQDISAFRGTYEIAQREKKATQIKNIEFEKRFLNCFFTPILSQDHHEFIGTVILIEDITEMTLLMKNRDEFFAIASRELKTPLSSITWNLDTILEKQTHPVSETARGLLEKTSSAVEFLNSLVEDIVMVARISQGEMSQKEEPVSVAAEVKMIINNLQKQAQARSISISLDSTNDDITIFANRHGFQEIVRNLLSNAIKYNHEGGSVTLSIHETTMSVALDIKDTGIGIPEAEQPKLFTRFFRASNAINSLTPGTGLGLYIVKTLIELWGGSIEFESGEGSGSTFRLSIPRVNTSTSQA